LITTFAPKMTSPSTSSRRQLGGDVAQATDNGLARKAQRALGVPALLTEAHKLCCRVNCLGQVGQSASRPEGRRRLWSQIHGLSANVPVPRLERTSRDDVHSYTQQFLKILE
jgi:hypothetical protein